MRKRLFWRHAKKVNTWVLFWSLSKESLVSHPKKWMIWFRCFFMMYRPRIGIYFVSRIALSQRSSNWVRSYVYPPWLCSQIQKSTFNLSSKVVLTREALEGIKVWEDNFSRLCSQPIWRPSQKIELLTYSDWTGLVVFFTGRYESSTFLFTWKHLHNMIVYILTYLPATLCRISSS